MVAFIAIITVVISIISSILLFSLGIRLWYENFKSGKKEHPTTQILSNFSLGFAILLGIFNTMFSELLTEFFLLLTILFLFSAIDKIKKNKDK